MHDIDDVLELFTGQEAEEEEEDEEMELDDDPSLGKKSDRQIREDLDCMCVFMCFYVSTRQAG